MQQFQKLDELTFTEELDASMLRVIRSDAWRSEDRWVRLGLHDLTVRTCAGGDEELVARRLRHFFRLGIVKKEIRRIEGKRVVGIRVPATFNSRAKFTAADFAFLTACGIAPPMDTDGPMACAAAL